MSILEEVLLEEYGRSKRICEALEEEIATLPRGSVRTRVVGGREYYYLQYRDGDKVRSDYVRADEVVELREKVARRTQDIAALREQLRSQRQIEKALGRRLLDERSGA